MRIFIVIENNFEYNDEVYYPTEGGVAKEAYLSLKLAEERLNELTISFWRGNDLGDYCYDLSEIGLNSVDLDACRISQDYPNHIPQNHPTEYIKKLVDTIVGVVPYKIQALDVDETQVD